MEQQHVVILGASEKPGRYARMAQEELMAHGHFVYPITRDGGPNLGVTGYRSLAEIPTSIDTVTVYLRADNWEPFVPAIVEKGIKRVILNPGTEDDHLKDKLASAGVQVLEACTLVMLRTGQF
jgi:uncharacterized protein